MCGIYGMLLLKGAAPGQNHKRILTRLALGSQVRGRDATGMSFAKENSITYFKLNVPSNEFIYLSGAAKTIEEGFDTDHEKLYSIIGHTRQKTQGTEKVPGNNHPIRCGSLVGVHNGCISNDNSIFMWLKYVEKYSAERLAEVDSEAIFALINHYACGFKDNFYSSAINEQFLHKAPIARAIRMAIPRLNGSMACAMQDSENPKLVWLFKTNNPIVIKYYKNENTVIFASTENILDEAVKPANFSDPEIIKMAVNQCISFNLDKNTYNRFDIDAANYDSY